MPDNMQSDTRRFHLKKLTKDQLIDRLFREEFEYVTQVELERKRADEALKQLESAKLKSVVTLREDLKEKETELREAIDEAEKASNKLETFGKHLPICHNKDGEAFLTCTCGPEN